jgi:hypothetical protein
VLHIGLSIRYKLNQELNKAAVKVDLNVKPGSHLQEDEGI